MPRIKLCGLMREIDIETANEIHPDYIGFVFLEKSKRYVSPERAKELRTMLKPGIQAVGVFVRERPENIAALLEAGIIDIAQLHGGETDEEVLALKGLTGKPLIHAFRVNSLEDLSLAERSPADFVLLDNGAGGTGQAFDWALARSLKRPYFLAGGLGVENVAEAVRLLNPYAVDVSSGIETNGVKDPAKMQAFVRAARERTS